MVVGCWGRNPVGVRVLGGPSLAVKCQVACSGSGRITCLNLGTLGSHSLETYCLLAEWGPLAGCGSSHLGSCAALPLGWGAWLPVAHATLGTPMAFRAMRTSVPWDFARLCPHIPAHMYTDTNGNLQMGKNINHGL